MRAKQFLCMLLCAVLMSAMLPTALYAASEPPNLIFDVTEGNITIDVGADSGTLKVTYGEAQDVVDNIPGTQEITITGTTTTNTVTVSTGVAANITLSGADIDVSAASACAFMLQGNAAVTLTLAEGTNNNLKSFGPYVGLQVPVSASLTIGGIGSLEATGIEKPISFEQGAGIGSADGSNSGSITINSGTVTANGGFSAGIGGGRGGSNAGIITINGGTVTATAVDVKTGAGIGGGTSGNGGIVIINGGTVTASGNRGAGIGGGNYSNGGTVTINGGIVTAMSTEGNGIGRGYAYVGSNIGTVTINNGTVTVISESSSCIGDTIVIIGGSVNIIGNVPIQVTPTNGTDRGNQTVVLTEVAIPDASLGTEIVELTIPDASYYGTGDMFIDASGKLYLWMPEDVKVARVRTADKEYNWDSSSDSFIVDQDLPTVSGVSPSGASVSLNGSIEVIFSEEMRTDAGTVSLDGGITTLGGGSWNSEKTVYTAQYSALAYETNYTVTISGFEDYSGNTMNADSSHTLTTIAEPDTIAPVVSNVTPSGTEVSINGDIVITFNETISATSASSVLLNGSNTAITGGSWSVSDAVYTIHYSGLSYSTPYTVTISGFEDAAGNAMSADSNHTFTTVANTTSNGESSGYSVTYYIITATASTGGIITPGGSISVAYGNDKTYTITANEGYEIEDVLVDDISVGVVSTYTFDNVKKAHTIMASFKEKIPETVNPFSDVASTDWFYENVMYVYKNSLMIGTRTDTFDPTGTMTRAMFITELHRMSGDTGSYTNTFTDITSGAWYENASAWALKCGIASGVGGNRFAPNIEITREQLAVMLYNYAKFKGYDVSVGENTNILSYNDALTISAYAYSALQWACSAGIMEGDSSGNLKPKSPITRAEAAAMIERFIKACPNAHPQIV